MNPLPPGPRCGHPMRAREDAGRPYDPAPVCGRPAHQTGRHLSQWAYRRQLDSSRLLKAAARAAARRMSDPAATVIA